MNRKAPLRKRTSSSDAEPDGKARHRYDINSTNWFEYSIPGYIRPHSLYGLAGRPGTHTITMGHLQDRKDFTMTLGADGFRITRPPAQPQAEKPELWIFGCSITFGFAVDDDEALPWLLQSRFPDISVRSFAFPSWGTNHAVLALMEALKTGTPAAAIFTYNPFHSERDVASPNRLKYLAQIDLQSNGTTHLRAGLLENGELYFDYVPLVAAQLEHLDKVDAKILRIDPYYAGEVTRRLYAKARDLLAEEGASLLVVLQSGDEDDPVYGSFGQIGIRTANLGVPWTAENCSLPFDMHPNAVAHAKYADALSPLINDLLGARRI